MFVSQVQVDNMGKEINQFAIKMNKHIEALEARIAELELTLVKQPAKKVEEKA